MSYVSVDIEIEDVLEQVSDEELIAEYNERGLGGGMTKSDEREILERIWIADREGRKDEAYALMREYVLNKLNKVV